MMEDLIKSGIRILRIKKPNDIQYTRVSLENYTNASVSDTIRAFKIAVEKAKFEDFYYRQAVSEEEKAEFFRQVVKEIERGIKKYRATSLPANFEELLENPKKSRQQKILSNAQLNHGQLWSFFLKAEEKGYNLSHYSSEHLPNGIKHDDLPTLFENKPNGSISVLGETNLSHAQLLQVLEHRKRTKAWILENGENWLCFFFTDKSMTGQEKNKIRHMHFISNAWTRPKEWVISELQKKKYNINSSWHIEYTEVDSVF